MDSTRSTPEHDARPDRTRAGRGAPRILLAEDDDEMRDLLVTALKKEGFKVTGCCDAIDLVNVLEGYIAHRAPLEYDLIVSDIRMPWLTGLEMLKEFKTHVGFPPVILITAFGDDATHKKAQALGATALLDKPFEMSRLIRIIRESLAKPHEPDRPGGHVTELGGNRGQTDLE